MKIQKLITEEEDRFEPITVEITIESQEELDALQEHFELVSSFEYEAGGVSAASSEIIEDFVDAVYQEAIKEI